jgi:putative transposase
MENTTTKTSDLQKRRQEIRTGRHCVFNLHVHLVFVTKYRQKVFTKEHLEFMRTILADICVDYQAQLVEFDGEVEYVHLLINYPPQAQVSKMINSLKGVSSRLLKKTIPKYHKMVFQQHVTLVSQLFRCFLRWCSNWHYSSIY